MRRFLLIPIIGLSICLSPVTATASTDSSQPVGTDVGTEETAVTLAGGKSLSDCISAAPKPECRTSNTADGKQIALLGFLVAGLGFVGWNITRGIKKNGRNANDPGAPLG